MEEISACTGIPAMYIEDELPRLEYGEALQKTANKYVTNFIIFRLADRASMTDILTPMIKEVADCCEQILWGRDAELQQIGFYKCETGMERLGYIFIPYFLRKRIRELKNGRLNLPDGNFPPRKDGGYGWFHIQETPDEKEHVTAYNTGCNSFHDGHNGGINYYWISRYFDQRIYHGGLEWMFRQNILPNSPRGIIPGDMLTEDDILRLLEANLIQKKENVYQLNFARFTQKQFREACKLFPMEDGRLDDLLCDRILAIRTAFEKFVPKHLYSQINQWVACFSAEIISYVVEEMIQRGKLAKPDPDRVFVDGVFYVEGENIKA